MGSFGRFLTLWVALCIIVGIGLGQAVPGVFHALGAATVAQVNLPVAVSELFRAEGSKCH